MQYDSFGTVHGHRSTHCNIYQVVTFQGLAEDAKTSRHQSIGLKADVLVSAGEELFGHVTERSYQHVSS